MKPDELALFIQTRGEAAFYTGRAWRKKRIEVLRAHRFECQDCKARGKYSRATVVHHERPLKQYPKLGLTDYFTGINGEKIRNLTPLCRECHELREGRADFYGRTTEKNFSSAFNEEKW